MPTQETVRLEFPRKSMIYGPDAWWPMSKGEKVSPSVIFFLDGLCSAYQDRLQRIRPDFRKDHYYWHHRRFIEDFLDRNTDVRDTPELVLIGREKEFDRVEPIVRARRETIASISEKEPKKIAVFIRDGATMDSSYRAVGVNNPPFYSLAVAGALDVYLNTSPWHSSMLGNPRDPDRLAVRRVIGHEPSHALWNSVFVDENGKPTWQLDKNRMVYEALAGPLEMKAWEDVDTSRITAVDFTPLERAVVQIANGQSTEDNFGSWLNVTSERNGIYDYHPLESPTWALFYQWASQKGNEKYWYELAKKLHR